MAIAASAPPHDHLVQFYDHEVELVGLVSAYLHDALRAGDIAVVVATGSHADSFQSALSELGIDVPAARAAGDLVVLDAAATLARFMTDTGPDAAAYDAVIGALVRQCRSTGRNVRAYGEMVALLWADQQVVAALELEKLWNDLAQRVTFTVLCAYPTASVSAAERADDYAHVCGLHSFVVADEAELRGALDTALHVDVVAREFEATLHAARAARQFVVETLSEWGREHLTADASIVVTELAANAVIHGDSAFVVEVSRSAASVRISVLDDGTPIPAMRSPAATAESGRGLGLVAALSHRWGHHAMHGGKLVWAELR